LDVGADYFDEIDGGGFGECHVYLLLGHIRPCGVELASSLSRTSSFVPDVERLRRLCLLADGAGVH
jgi:hypothetical protein